MTRKAAPLVFTLGRDSATAVGSLLLDRGVDDFNPNVGFRSNRSLYVTLERLAEEWGVGTTGAALKRLTILSLTYFDVRAHDLIARIAEVTTHEEIGGRNVRIPIPDRFQVAATLMRQGFAEIARAKGEMSPEEEMRRLAMAARRLEKEATRETE